MTKKENSEDDDDIISPSKRNRSNANNNNNTNSSSSGTRIINNDMVNELELKPSESWNTVFKNKIKKGPTVSGGTYACLKFHVKGICYDDCSFRASHIKLEGDDLLKTKEFVKKLRDEA